LAGLSEAQLHGLYQQTELAAATPNAITQVATVDEHLAPCGHVGSLWIRKNLKRV